MTATANWEVLDPLVLWLDAEVGTGESFHLSEAVDGLRDAGFDLTRIQVYRGVYYLHRTMSLLDGFTKGYSYRGLRGGWYRWTGTVAQYDERRAANGNVHRWRDGTGWDGN